MDQGPRSNFEIGGGGENHYWLNNGGGSTRYFFLLNLYSFKNIGGGGLGTCPPALPTPQSLWTHEHNWHGLMDITWAWTRGQYWH